MKQATRLLDFIEEFDFICEHRSGRLHGNCDALWRKSPDDGYISHSQNATEAERREESSINSANCCRVEETSRLPPKIVFSNATVAAAQRNDPVLLPLTTSLEAGETRPVWPDVPWINNEVRTLWSQYDSLEIENSVLCRKFYQSDGTTKYRQVVIAKSLQNGFILQLHERENNTVTAHLSICKIQEHIRHRAYWVG